MKIFKNIVSIVLGLFLFNEWTEGKRICHYTTAIDKAGNFQWETERTCNGITLGGVRACPPQYRESFKQSCYMVVNDVKLNRPEALNVCQRSSSHLLFIESQEERNFISNITTKKPCDYFWDWRDWRAIYNGMTERQWTTSQLVAKVLKIIVNVTELKKVPQHGTIKTVPRKFVTSASTKNRRTITLTPVYIS